MATSDTPSRDQWGDGKIASDTELIPGAYRYRKSRYVDKICMMPKFTHLLNITFQVLTFVDSPVEVSLHF